MFDWLFPGRSMTEREQVLVDVIKKVLEMEETEKVFPFGDHNCFIYNEDQDILIKISGMRLTIGTKLDIISEDLTIGASQTIDKMIAESTKRDIERLKAVWTRKEAEALDRVKDSVVGYETVSEIGKE